MLNTQHLLDYDEALEKTAIPIFGYRTSDVENAGEIAADEGGDGIKVPTELRELAKANGFSGAIGEVLCLSQGVLVGFGDGEDPFAIASASGKLAENTYRLGAGFEAVDKNLLALGWLLGGYRFDRYKSHEPAQAKLICPKGVECEHIRREAEASALVRDLVNTPASDMMPDHLEEVASDLAARFDANLVVVTGDALIEQNLPMIHAVGRASISPPRLIDLNWAPKGVSKNAPKITLVGKGVCFDSGGLNIKGGSGMSLMKKDMGGGAHALALAQMIMQAKLPLRLRVLIPAVENAIDGSAFRPSDILPSRKGLSVEIGNTDAEGRLILADALCLGAEDEPDFMVSLATLTGAARVALGPEIIPFYCDNDELSRGMAEQAKALFDPAWPMPLWQRYQAMLSSSVADMNNIASGGFAGSIIGALFLQRFVANPMKWMHFDLYAWRPSSEPGRPKGGEAQCIRALFALIREKFVA